MYQTLTSIKLMANLVSNAPHWLPLKSSPNGFLSKFHIYYFTVDIIIYREQYF